MRKYFIPNRTFFFNIREIYMDQKKKKSEVNESFLSHSLLQENNKKIKETAPGAKRIKKFDFIKKSILCDLRVVSYE